jgi:hypothetical protein
MIVKNEDDKKTADILVGSQKKGTAWDTYTARPWYLPVVLEQFLPLSLTARTSDLQLITFPYSTFSKGCLSIRGFTSPRTALTSFLQLSTWTYLPQRLHGPLTFSWVCGLLQPLSLSWVHGLTYLPQGLLGPLSVSWAHGLTFPKDCLDLCSSVEHMNLPSPRTAWTSIAADIVTKA